MRESTGTGGVVRRIWSLSQVSLTIKTLAFAALGGGAGWLFSASLSPAAEARLSAALLFAGLVVIAAAWLKHRLGRVHALLDGFAGRMGVRLPEQDGGDNLCRLENRLQYFSEEVMAAATALEYRALHDPLTGLPNRSVLLERLGTALCEAREQGSSLALLIMDLDHFKEVNDTLGHQMGDRLLQQAGRRLEAVLRDSDTVARLGGDEFAVLLPKADGERSRAVCRRILAVMEEPVSVDDLRLRAAISIGVVLYPEHGDAADLLMRAADTAMYEAKRAQRGYAFYTPGDDEHAISRLGLSAELGEAITRNQLTLDYQPMVDVKTGRILCAEALVRWRHPVRGLLGPSAFIPLAERTGGIRPLTLWVIDRALGQIRQWAEQGLDMHISVNLSVRSLQDRALPAQVQKLVHRHRVNPAHVILEVTESALMSDPETARRVMRRLSNMGFHLSIDDFGTGYSSLAYLKQLPVDEVKIDRSFVSQMHRDENDAEIVRATIDLAHNLGLKVVAEGVESRDVWRLLEVLGCDTVQGYLVHSPLGPAAFASWVDSGRWREVHGSVRRRAGSRSG